MVGRREPGVERGQGICTKEHRVESGNNLVASQCTSSRTWKIMEDNRISH